MPLTNGSMPMKPVRGCRSASAIRCSPPPKPLSTRTSSTSLNSERKSAGRRPRNIELELRQQRAEQRGLVPAQRMALAPAEERAVFVFAFASSSIVATIKNDEARHKAGRPRDYVYANCEAYFSALLSWLTRLVCSQEKPPSLSGARPKWP